MVDAFDALDIPLDEFRRTQLTTLQLIVQPGDTGFGEVALAVRASGNRDEAQNCKAGVAQCPMPACGNA